MYRRLKEENSMLKIQLDETKHELELVEKHLSELTEENNTLKEQLRKLDGDLIKVKKDLLKCKIEVKKHNTDKDLSKEILWEIKKALAQIPNKGNIKQLLNQSLNIGKYKTIKDFVYEEFEEILS